MEATLTAPAPIQADFWAHLHQVTDQIQDEAVLRAALLLLPQVVPAEPDEPELSPARQQELDHRLREYDASRSIPFAEVMGRLMQPAT